MTTQGVVFARSEDFFIAPLLFSPDDVENKVIRRNETENDGMEDLW